MSTRSRRVCATQLLLLLRHVLLVAAGCGAPSSGDAGLAKDAARDVRSAGHDGPSGGPSDATLAVDGRASPDATSPAVDAWVKGVRSYPTVPDTEGLTMKDPRVVTVVASNDVFAAPPAPLASFTRALAKSELWRAVSAEYDLGSLSPAAFLTGPAMPAEAYSTGELLDYVAALLATDAGAAYSPDGRTIYLLYLPDGASLLDFPTGACGGFHVAFPLVSTSTGDQLAAVERCPPDPYDSQLGELTNTATHEVVESATDPLGQGYNLGPAPATPWSASVWQSSSSSGGAELADLCEGTRTYEATDGGPDGGWEYQRIWSNRSASAPDGGDPCIPPSGAPYYSVEVPQGWYALPADGGVVTIPLTAWSTAPTSDWLISVHLLDSDPNGVLGAAVSAEEVGIASPLGVGNPGCLALRQALNDGENAVLEVRAPPGTPSGDFAVIGLHSFREDSACLEPLAGDYFHFIPVGVYVP